MPRSRIDARSRVMRLRDGRRLGYAEYGDPKGNPLFLFHGTPGHRLQAELLMTGEEPGWRVIAPDRPGLGLSDRLPQRRLLDWPDDVRQLADHLGLQRFWVAGVSGGACHALVCAYALPERVIAAASVCGGAPLDSKADVAAMHGPNRATFRIAQSAPSLLYPLLFLSTQLTMLALRLPERWQRRLDASTEKALPAPDRQVMRDPRLKEISKRIAPETARQGVAGIVDDVRIHAMPWGFDAADITVPVLQFHGELDMNAPLALARKLEAVIPNARLTVFPGEGHLIVPRHWKEITEALGEVAA